MAAAWAAEFEAMATAGLRAPLVAQLLAERFRASLCEAQSATEEERDKSLTFLSPENDPTLAPGLLVDVPSTSRQEQNRPRADVCPSWLARAIDVAIPPHPSSSTPHSTQKTY
jgi:hypothetical protein